MKSNNFNWLLIMFFISGISAIFYQIAWQRLLFQSFGVDLESVTVIVSAFMAGLGIGALVGGWVADRRSDKLIVSFCLIELIIGFYGLISFQLFRLAGDFFVTSSLPVIALVNFLLVFVPTVAMGATLPILIIFITTKLKNVGRATGVLYAINTLGASLGCFFAGFVIFNFQTLQQTIYIASALNFIVSSYTFIKTKRAS